MIRTAWHAEEMDEMTPNVGPRADEVVWMVLAEEEWFGSNRRPEKKPDVTISAAVRERRDG